MASRIWTSKKIIPTVLLSLWPLLISLLLILRLLIGKHIQCTLVAYFQRQKTPFSPFRKRFNIWKTWVVPSFFLLIPSEYGLTANFWHFNWKIHQTYLFCCRLHCKIHQAHFLSLFVTARNVTFLFLPSKHQSYFFSYFETSKYFRGYIVCVFFPCKYVISAVFCSLTCNWIRRTFLVPF